MTTTRAVDQDKRYDAFISFHGSEELETLGISPSSSNEASRSTTVRGLALSVVAAIRRGSAHRKRIPNVFLDDEGLPERLSELFDAILQTRGNGVALCLMTEAYFRRKTCLAELLSFLDIDRHRNDNIVDDNSRRGECCVKLRLLNLEKKRSVDKLLREDLLVHNFIPNLKDYRIHQIRGDTVASIADEVAEIVWDAWTDTSHPTVLGGTIEKSFLDLCTFFSDNDVSMAKMVLGMPRETARNSGIIDVLHHWTDTKGFGVVEPLRELALRAGPHSEACRVVDAYKHKWITSGRWSWDESERGRLLDKLQEAQDIIEQSRIEEYERTEEQERSSVDLAVMSVFDVTANALWTHELVSRLYERVDNLFFTYLESLLSRGPTRIVTLFLFSPPMKIKSVFTRNSKPLDAEAFPPSPLVLTMFSVGRDKHTNEQFRDWAGSKHPSKPLQVFRCTGRKGENSYLAEEIFSNNQRTPFLMPDPKSKNGPDLIIVPLLRDGVPFGAIQLTSRYGENYGSLLGLEQEAATISDECRFHLRLFNCDPTPLGKSDFLTGLPDHGSFWRDAKRRQFGFLFVLDIDNFGSYNNSSLLEGDQVLRQVGVHLRKSLQYPNTAYRYGGDEFCALIGSKGDTDPYLGKAELERAFQNIELSGGRRLDLRASMGYAKNMDEKSIVELFREAEEHMREAKKEFHSR